MTETIISSLISGGVALFVCVVTQVTSQKKTTALIEYRLSELQRRVEAHNSLIDRTYKLEERTELQEQRLNALERR